jgi:hypothetical protein
MNLAFAPLKAISACPGGTYFLEPASAQNGAASIISGIILTLIRGEIQRFNYWGIYYPFRKGAHGFAGKIHPGPW